MHRLSYIFPIVAAVGTMLWLDHIADWWWAYLLCVVVAEGLLYLAIHRAARQREYLSGYALNVQHHEPWVERVVYTESYTDSRGNTRTRTKVRYVHHPDRWLVEFNTGYEADVTQEVYLHYAELWGTDEEWINPPHMNCVSGGGGQLYAWNEVYADACTTTYYGLYVNYIKNSRSIFRFREIDEKEAASLGLIDYPKLHRSDLEGDVVVASSLIGKGYTISDGEQRAIQLFNAFEGERHQIHCFVLLFDASQQSLQVAMEQRAYWEGGNKNEFAVCLGIDTSKPQPEVVWCEAFSWCDVPRLESAAESWFIAHRQLDLKAFAAWLHENVALWKRKQFSDFKYLGIRLSPSRTAIVMLLALLLAALIVGVGYAIEQNQPIG
ncbi:MAG: hypothetical protein IJ998_08680 [Alistipes sp.]|nr:hypothetical protein [Alistipes sp.]